MARAGRGTRLSDRVRNSPDRRRVPLGAHSEEFGGSGLGLSAAAAILDTMHAEGCNGAASHAQIYIMGTILRHGSEAQKARYLPAIARGHLRLQALGVTEPTSGTNTTSLRTVARREGEHYVVSGLKIWTSRAQHSDLMLLLARTMPRSEVAKKTEGLSVLVVDMQEVGGKRITIGGIRTMMNHNTREVFFDNVRIPADRLLGGEGQGFRYILSGMNAERILIGAECIGDAKWFIAKSTEYPKSRQVFGRPIGANQGLQFAIAKAYAQMRGAELMVRESAARYEGGDKAAEEANIAKMLAADASLKRPTPACRRTAGLASQRSMTSNANSARRVYQVAPISTNLILANLAEHVLGLPRSY